MSDEKYIVAADGITLINQDYIYGYIMAICNEMNVLDLDISVITQNVYPKLKQYNTIGDIEQQIITSTIEMADIHFDYPKIATWILITNLHSSTHDDYLLVARDLKSNINQKGEAISHYITRFL